MPIQYTYKSLRQEEEKIDTKAKVNPANDTKAKEEKKDNKWGDGAKKSKGLLYALKFTAPALWHGGI